MKNMQQAPAPPIASPVFRAALLTLAFAAGGAVPWAADNTAVAAKPLPAAIVDTLKALPDGPHVG
jgi:hypothetical protein